MTTTAHTDTMTAAPSRTPLLIALGLGASAVLTAIGNFGGDTDHSVSEWLITVAVAAVVAVVVFALVVRTAATGNPGRRSAVVGVVGVLSIAVFWAGIPMVLAAAATACALIDRDRTGSFETLSKVGLGLALLTSVVAIALAFIG